MGVKIKLVYQCQLQWPPSKFQLNWSILNFFFTRASMKWFWRFHFFHFHKIKGCPMGLKIKLVYHYQLQWPPSKFQLNWSILNFFFTRASMKMFWPNLLLPFHWKKVVQWGWKLNWFININYNGHLVSFSSIGRFWIFSLLEPPWRSLGRFHFFHFHKIKGCLLGLKIKLVHHYQLLWPTSKFQLNWSI